MSNRSFTYAKDSQFWELVARAVTHRGESALPPLFEALSAKSLEQDIPVTFGGVKSLSWARICQIFLLYQDRMPAFGRKEYLAMIAGSKRVFRPSHFARIAVRRIVANISYPSSPGRTMKESVADTFLANGLTVTEGYEGSSMDGLILSRALADIGIMALCDRVVTPPSDLWSEVAAAYGKRRKGIIQRKWEDLWFWIFNR